MAVIKVTHLDPTNPARVHMFGNMAEDVARSFRDDPGIDVTLEEVDRGHDTLFLRTRPSLKGRTLQTLRRVVRRHGMETDVRIDAD